MNVSLWWLIGHVHLLHLELTAISKYIGIHIYNVDWFDKKNILVSIPCIEQIRFQLSFHIAGQGYRLVLLNHPCNWTEVPDRGWLILSACS